MNDKLYPISIQQLITWILAEYKTHHILGIHKDLFFIPSESDPFQMQRYHQHLETPIGVAAGPHTQLSQNIIAAWLCGARYMELKTVQTLDELDVSKPCIDMQDEGYNCEWSQELKLKQSLDEYLNAWIAIHVLRHHFGWNSDQGPGLIFNMSVGYDLAGIMKPNIQHFMDLMANSQELLDNKLNQLSAVYPQVQDLNISPQMTDSITLSTMHGCPPDEIERIACYLISERKLHTAVKLNPTLLGPERLRQILTVDLGFDSVHVPSAAFEHDLKYDDALHLINRLQSQAQKTGVQFGLKLTNTLEVENHRPIFPERETMMYLSGRALHPISINLAAKLQKDYHGKLDVSFSAGTDAFNIVDTLACNMRPVTTCTDILKPGGYTRLGQYLSKLHIAFSAINAGNLDEFILKKAGAADLAQAGLDTLIQYADHVTSNPRYHKNSHHFDSIKTSRKLETFDCISAPCIDACAADQNIPEYLYQTSQGNFEQAFAAIQDTNPLPGVTGQVCDHLCQLKCTRNNYDSPILIREIKRFVTEREIGKTEPVRPKILHQKVSVIGAGPAGLSCAYFLAKAGVAVTIYETKPFAGGMVSDAIPEFRLTDETIDLDILVLKKLGVQFNFETPVNKSFFSKLRQQQVIFIGVGAQQALKLGIEGETLKGVLDPLNFLSDVRQGARPDLGRNIIIIGGGNTAMDAARTALRLAGKEAVVSILYRRTMAEMPADIDEIEAALDEGITLHELMAPLNFIGSETVQSIQCQKMELGEPDASGRRRPVPVEGQQVELPVDTVIPAIGQTIKVDFIEENDLGVNLKTCATSIPNVYAGGDAVRGASSVINAIGDGQVAARQILKKFNALNRPDYSVSPRIISIHDLKVKAATRELGFIPSPASLDLSPDFPLVHPSLTEEEAIAEASRCLLCDDFCSVCVGVCPNLANLTYFAKPVEYPVQEISTRNGVTELQNVGPLIISQEPQVLNIGDFCNECGNCTTFCPTAGDPFKDKPRIHLSEQSFNASESGYRFSGNTLYFKSKDSLSVLTFHDGDFLFHSPMAQVRFDGNKKTVDSFNLEPGNKYFSTLEALEMIVLFESLKDNPILS